MPFGSTEGTYKTEHEESSPSPMPINVIPPKISEEEPEGQVGNNIGFWSFFTFIDIRTTCYLIQTFNLIIVNKITIVFIALFFSMIFAVIIEKEYLMKHPYYGKAHKSKTLLKF